MLSVPYPFTLRWQASLPLTRQDILLATHPPVQLETHTDRGLKTKRQVKSSEDWTRPPIQYPFLITTHLTITSIGQAFLV